MRILLLPFSILYRIAVFIRNKLYDQGLLKITSLNAIVISVGNISTGGTGKTPMVEFLTDYFIKRNKFVTIILKGYKRTHDDIQVAELGFKNENHKITTEKFSDEGLVFLDAFQNTEPGKGLIIISDNKKSGARLADDKFKPDLVLIDDGFQHRKIKRNLDIVMLGFNFKRHLLPAGDLREPFKNLHRADVIIQNHKFDKDIHKHIKGIPKNTVDCTYEFNSFVNTKGEILEINSLKAIAFCGIGDPESFLNLMNNLKINVIDFLKYPDHYNYLKADLDKILNLYTSSGANSILTTYKDFVRIKYSARLNDAGTKLLLNYPIYYAKIKLQIPKSSNILIDKLDDLIRQL